MLKSFVIPYTPKDRETSAVANTVILSQQEWDAYEGKMTNTSMVNAIANLIYGTSGFPTDDPDPPDIPTFPTGGETVYKNDGTVLQEEREEVYYSDGTTPGTSKIYYSSTGQALYAAKPVYSSPDSGGRVSRAYVLEDLYKPDGAKVVSDEIEYDESGAISGGGQALASTSIGGNTSPLGGVNTTEIACDNLIDGDMKAVVYAYPQPSNLSFSLRISHGFISSLTYSYDNYRDLIQCRLQDPDLPLSPQYPVYAIQSYSWLGDCYDEDGSITTPPSVTVVNGELYVSRRVYGTLDVTYSTRRAICEVTIPQRIGLEGKEAYKSVVYAVFNGGITWEEVDPSPVVDAESMCVEWDTDVNFHPKEYPPIADPKDKTQEWDYCSLNTKGEPYFS